LAAWSSGKSSLKKARDPEEKFGVKATARAQQSAVRENQDVITLHRGHGSGLRPSGFHKIAAA